MMPSHYENALEVMGLTKEEKELTSSMPDAVAYGYVCARRKAGGGKRDMSSPPNISDLFGGAFG